MQLFHAFHRNKIIKKLHSDFWLYEFSVWLHTFSRSLIAIFIPILFLNLGYTVAEVLFWYFIFNIFNIPFNFLARWLTRRIGARYVMIIGKAFSILSFLGLMVLKVNSWPLLISIALMFAIYDALYWVPHLYLFMITSKNDDNISKDVSTLSILSEIAGVLAPVIGALILIFVNQQVLILVSIIILILSIWPIWKIKKIKDKPNGKQKTLKQFFNNKIEIKNYITSSLNSVHNSVESVIWPIFIFVLFESIESVALLPIIISITTMVFMYLAGGITKKNRRLLIVLGGCLVAITWLLRISVDNTIFYYFSVFLVGLFSILIDIPLDSSLLESGERKDALTASMYMNVTAMLPKIFLFGVLLLVVNVFKASFIIAALGMLLIMILNLVFKEKPRYSILKNS